MKNIFIFIRRYFNFLFFMTLQVICIILLVKNSNTYGATYANVANEVTGLINTQYNTVHNYFNLRENNLLLQEENTRLKNLLGSNFESTDTSYIKHTDSLMTDTLGKQRKYLWLPAKVVNNTISQQYNYMTIHRGANQGVKKDMAVMSSKGIAGTIIDVSENYSRAMSLLHRNSKVSSMLKKSQIPGSVEWDGKDPYYLTLRNIPKSTPVTKGDSVVTSNYSANFPPNMMIGTVTEITKDPGSNYFIIQIKTSTNFYTLEYVNIVENLQLEEQSKLEAVKVKNE
jgi:rod shape-determining protein MreC